MESSQVHDFIFHYVDFFGPNLTASFADLHLEIEKVSVNDQTLRQKT
jgi:hypothetical protein